MKLSIVTIALFCSIICACGGNGASTPQTVYSPTVTADTFVEPKRVPATVPDSPKVVIPRHRQHASRTRRVTEGLTEGGIWDKLAECESSGNWAANTGNGFYGGIQFDLSSWHEAGGVGRPDLATRAEQIKRGKIWQSRYGWNPWPACSRKLGLR